MTSLAQSSNRVPRVAPPASTNPEADVALLKIRREADAAAALGDYLLEQNNPQGAIAQYKKAQSIVPTVGRGSGLARAYTALGRTREAVDAYRMLVYDWPGKRWSSSEASEPFVLMNFALVLNETKERREAAAIYNRAAESLAISDGDLPNHLYRFQQSYDPTLFEASARLVLARRYENEKAKSAKRIAELRRATTVAPRYAAGHYWLGRALREQKQYAAAQAEFSKAATLGRGAVKTDAEEALGLFR